MYKFAVVIVSLFLFVSSTAENSSAASGAQLNLDLATVASLVKEKNERIKVKKMEWDIRNEAVKNAKGIFEPDLVSTVSRSEDERISLSKDQALKQSAYDTSTFEGLQQFVQDINKLGEDDQTLDRISVAVEKVIPSGAVFRTFMDYSVLENLYTKNDDPDGNDEDTVVIGASIRQPLLKNFGEEITRTNIWLAEADADMEFQSYRLQLMGTISDAFRAYWDYYLNQEIMALRLSSIETAEQILNENRERVRLGRMAETEVLEAEAAVATRKAKVSEARQGLLASRNNLMIYISSQPTGNGRNVHATERMNNDKISVSFDESMVHSLRLRPEYLTAQRKITQAGVRVTYMENQTWPQLDLIASYAVNGADKSFNDTLHDALKASHGSWNVGLGFRMPLGDNERGEAELAAARYRKRQALEELKAVEVTLTNAIEAYVENIDNSYNQLVDNQRAEVFFKQLLDVELEKLAVGKSTSRDIFDREEKFYEAREDTLGSMVNYQASITGLLVTEGRLLEKYAIEPEPVAEALESIQ